MKIRYAHTNLIARDWRRVSLFYQRVFGCKPVPPERDLTGDWVDRLTGIRNAHLTGEHLALPGYGDPSPTLEILSYDSLNSENPKAINGIGLAHLAFEVEDVAAVLQKVIQEGGGQIGELVQTEFPNQAVATFVYATDIEGNIVELQHWEKRSSEQ
ncbi:VOC family protein [Cohnella sp. AR92]|nr:VOC family protein [Cohnella sp. AR92]